MTASPVVNAISLAPCPDGSGTEQGLVPAAVRLYRAVCAAFPALQHYGGWDAHGEHRSGKAIDFMIDGNAALGREVADWIRAHAEIEVTVTKLLARFPNPAVTFVLACLVVFFNFLADVIYGWLDPRISYR